MNILYIEHYAGSPDMGMEFRPYYLSREWVRMGNRVDIIAADYSHLRLNNPQIKHDFERCVIDGINYHWVHTIKYGENGLKRAVTMLQFVGKLYSKAKWIAEKFKPDVIITSSTYPLDTYAGQRIKKFRPEARLIHEIHDMWPAVLTEVNGMSNFNPFVISMGMAERSFCKHSDRVVSLPPCAKEYLMECGMAGDKFLSVANGINIEDWTQTEELNATTTNILQNLHEKNKFTICFFGSITNYYALPELIKAVQSLKNDNIVVVFIGEGVLKDHLKKLAQLKNPERFMFLDKIPKRQVPEMLRLVDALYVGGAKNTIFKYGISMNKLTDSMMSGKPIIYAVDAPNNYVTEYNCGISVEPGDIDALAEGINELYRMDNDKRRQLGGNGHRAAMEFFTYDKLAAKFASVF